MSYKFRDQITIRYIYNQVDKLYTYKHWFNTFLSIGNKLRIHDIIKTKLYV